MKKESKSIFLPLVFIPMAGHKQGSSNCNDSDIELHIKKLMGKTKFSPLAF